MNIVHRILQILAQAWSILLYPLWIPTYSMLLYMSLFSSQEALRRYWMVTLIGTFVITAVIPISLIIIRMIGGKVKDLYINDAGERTVPYLYTSVCYGAWCYLLAGILHMPLFVVTSAIGATVALLIVTLVNHWWKISAHLVALGGLLGGMAACCLAMQQHTTIWFVLSLLCIAMLLCYARIYTKAHTPMQTIIGLLLGLSCTFIPNYIIYYATL